MSPSLGSTRRKAPIGLLAAVLVSSTSPPAPERGPLRPAAIQQAGIDRVLFENQLISKKFAITHLPLGIYPTISSTSFPTSLADERACRSGVVSGCGAQLSIPGRCKKGFHDKTLHGNLCPHLVGSGQEESLQAISYEARRQEFPAARPDCQTATPSVTQANNGTGCPHDTGYPGHADAHCVSCVAITCLFPPRFNTKQRLLSGEHALSRISAPINNLEVPGHEKPGKLAIP